MEKLAAKKVVKGIKRNIIEENEFELVYDRHQCCAKDLDEKLNNSSDAGFQPPLIEPDQNVRDPSLIDVQDVTKNITASAWMVSEKFKNGGEICKLFVEVTQFITWPES